MSIKAVEQLLGGLMSYLCGGVATLGEGTEPMTKLARLTDKLGLVDTVGLAAGAMRQWRLPTAFWRLVPDYKPAHPGTA